jgi:hypothetical protein
MRNTMLHEFEAQSRRKYAMKTNRFARTVGYLLTSLTLACGSGATDKGQQTAGAPPSEEERPKELAVSALNSFPATHPAINALGVHSYEISSISNGKVTARLKGSSGSTVGELNFTQAEYLQGDRFFGYPGTLSSVTLSGGTLTHDKACTSYELEEGVDDYLEGYVGNDGYVIQAGTCDQCSSFLPAISRSNLDRLKAGALLRADLQGILGKAGLLPEVDPRVKADLDAWAVRSSFRLSPDACWSIVAECMRFCDRVPHPAGKVACMTACLALYAPCRLIPGVSEQQTFMDDSSSIFGF